MSIFRYTPLSNLESDERRCYKCNKVKSIFEFTKDRAKSQGRDYLCKDCGSIRNKSEYMKNYRKNNREKFREGYKRWAVKHQDQLKANQKLIDHIKRGKITRGDCSVCHTPNAEGHHPDYSKPLEVIWYCKKHHSMWHRLGYIPFIETDQAGKS